MEKANRKTRKAWCPNSDGHDNMEKERDTEASLLNFIKRAKYNFSALQRTDTFTSKSKISKFSLKFFFSSW
jgi:hypothetical protein